jgi:hypothetical protein
VSAQDRILTFRGVFEGKKEKGFPWRLPSATSAVWVDSYSCGLFVLLARFLPSDLNDVDCLSEKVAAYQGFNKVPVGDLFSNAKN